MPEEPPFKLADRTAAAQAACRLFDVVQPVLLANLPSRADIRHIGSTAVIGCLTKGDLDIVVRVSSDVFAAADAALSSLYSRNTGSCRTEFFSSFEDALSAPHLGIQLVIIDSPLDDFHRFSEALAVSPGLVVEYNELKKRFQGAEMRAYRAAKDAFIERVLATASK